MTEKKNKLTDTQAWATRLVLIGAWGGVLFVPLAGWWAGNAPLPLLVASLLFAGLGTLCQRQRASFARIGATLALVGQAIVLNAAFAGHPWQIDMHMLYFALLAAAIVMNDARAIIIAAATIAVHHLVLTIAMPSLVYPSANWVENVPRTALHGLVVVIETAALVYAIIARHRVDATATTQQQELAIAKAQADSARETAESARERAETAQAESEAAKTSAEQALQHAENEATRARESDRAARNAAENEAAARAETAEQQKIVVDALSHGLRALRNCDLTQNIDTQFQPEYEELRDDFNVALTSLRGALETVLSHAETIGSETSGLVAAANHLAKRTEEQASSLAGITANVGELTTNVAAAADGARTARTEVVRTKTEAANSAGLVQQAVGAMTEIEDASKQIQTIVGVIEEISFQTNLLALNAGVEAARAGEAGRGFAVVASEVRALAQRASDAAKDIKGLIEKSDTLVEDGVKLVNQTGAANERVVSAVDDIVHLIEQIADSSEEQSTGLGQIRDALSKLDQVTQSNAAMFEETTAANHTLSAGTSDLVNAIAVFVSDADSARDQSRVDTAA